MSVSVPSTLICDTPSCVRTFAAMFLMSVMTSGAYRKIGYGEIVWREVNTATAIAKADQSATLAKENIESAVSDAN